ERAVTEVRRLADGAQAIGARAEAVETLAQAEALSTEVRKAADVALDASERARAVLGALRERISSGRAEVEAATSVAAEAAEQAAGASQVADQGEATLRELEQIVGSDPDPEIGNALEAVRTATSDARLAAASASAAADRAKGARTRSEAEPAAE